MDLINNEVKSEDSILRGEVEIDSVNDDLNKLGHSDSYSSDTSSSVFHKNKATSYDFAECWDNKPISQQVMDNSIYNKDLRECFENNVEQNLENEVNDNLEVGKGEVKDNAPIYDLNFELKNDLNSMENEIIEELNNNVEMMGLMENMVNNSKFTARTRFNYDLDDKFTLDPLLQKETFASDDNEDYIPDLEHSIDDYLLKTKRDDFDSKTDFEREVNPEIQRERSLSNFSNCDNVTEEFYKFELEKMSRIIKVLKEQLNLKDKEISKLEEKVQEYNEWKSELEPSKQASVIQCKAENDSVVALNFAKLQLQKKENETLTQRLKKMEEEHRMKDDELKSLRERIMENEFISNKFDRDLKSLEIDKQMLKSSIEGMEKTFRQREIQLKLNLDMEYQSQLSNVLKEKEELISLVTEKENEIENCKQLLKTAQVEFTQLLNSIAKLKEMLMKKNQEIEMYKKNVLKLETKLITNDKSSELRVSLENQSKMRERIRQLERKIEMINESFNVQSRLKEENLYLRAKVDHLEKGPTSEIISQSVLQLGNQILPLSLTSFKHN
ncbi:uncharacterized protein TA14620 [Theileria annulata]|uniref:Uncharacterized protein n=1 Tax=Theileria annulata TaxID=5874 RepID=Q4UF52_THEAN|nr:uncharacterized protein TA14620 [Theileria annulata]CAI74287.1 hypothetical protein, conserved [Theileria annulata]|eukprot:XP_952019.1 hypothetical protein, conserved [Theileria annulata]